MSSPQARAEILCQMADAARAAGRDPATIILLAVSKGQPAAAVAPLAAAGQRHFGESYVQEARSKQDALAAHDLVWHFIGRIQRNKTRAIAAGFDWVHAVDRLAIARRLNDQRPDDRPPLQVCLQVNVAGEASKGGAAATDVPKLAQAVAKLPRLTLRGLMAIPPLTTDPAAQALPYRQLRALYDELRDTGLVLDTLSMGMSGDFRVAIAEGATLVRIGTALFGPRSRRPPVPHG